MPTKELTEARTDRAFSLMHIGGLTAADISRQLEWDYSTTWVRLRSRTGDRTIREYVRGVRTRRAIILRRAFGMTPTETAKVMATTRQRIHYLLRDGEPCGNPLVVGRLTQVIQGTSFQTGDCVSVGWQDDKRAILRNLATNDAYYVPWSALLDKVKYVGLITGDRQDCDSPAAA